MQFNLAVPAHHPFLSSETFDGIEMLSIDEHENANFSIVCNFEFVGNSI